MSCSMRMARQQVLCPHSYGPSALAGVNLQTARRCRPAGLQRQYARKSDFPPMMVECAHRTDVRFRDTPNFGLASDMVKGFGRRQ